MAQRRLPDPRALVARLVCFGLLLAGLLLALPARTQPQQQELFLRIESGEHEADINTVIALPGEPALLSASDDKTARIWSDELLAPRAVLRPPLGPQDIGALYAAAASTEWIALAGHTRGPRGDFAVHLFTRANLRSPGMISSFVQPIVALRFSQDGRFLAVGMQDRGGLRVFDMTSQSERITDTGFEASITGLDFDPRGRLVVAAADGRIRLYGADGRRAGVAELPNRARPFGIAFSPDGSRIAVGDRNRPLVHMLDGATLRPVRSLSGAGADRDGSFNVVAFAPDGSVIAAGSYKDARGARLIRAWYPDGRARFEAAVAGNTVTALLADARGVVFASADPALGRIDPEGRMIMRRSARQFDFRNAGDTGHRIAHGGGTIELPAMPDGSRFAFDVEARELRPLGAVSVPLVSASDRGGFLTVTDWKNSPAPKLNGQPIALERGELARSVAVSAVNAAVALGSDHYLRYLAQGREVWRQVAPGPAWAVNVSPDGRRVVAGFGDGTIRWFSAATGQELAALFLEPATRRWVLWTPEGFFDHDQRQDGRADGRSLIGYARNAPDRRSAEFIEIGQLYPVFYRPDMVGLALRDTPQARQAVADQRERMGSVETILRRGLPPVVTLLDSCGREAGGKASGCPTQRVLDKAATGAAPMETGGDVLLVQYRLRERGGQLGGAIIRRNNAVITPALFVAEEAPGTRTEEATIPLGEGLNIIRITPVSASGQVEASEQEASEIRVLRVASAARAAGVQAAGATVQGHRPTIKPRTTLYVLSVGIGNFQRRELNLANPVNDASALARMMAAPSPPVYDTAEITLLTDADATAERILAALQDIARKALPDDLVLIFLAGHGQQVDGRYYFAPVDFGTREAELFRRAVGGGGTDGARALDELFRREGLGQDRMLPAIQAIQAARVAMVLDTCFSASIATQDAVLRRDVNTTITNTLGHAAGRFVLSSATALALDSAGTAADLPRDAQGHGLFTSFLMRALSGEADIDKNNRIDIYEVASFTRRNVTQATQDMRQPQHPAFFFAGSQFFDLRAVAPK